MARLIDDVYSGKVHLRVASGLAPLLSLQLRAIESTELEERVEKLEKLLAEPGGSVESSAQQKAQ